MQGDAIATENRRSLKLGDKCVVVGIVVVGDTVGIGVRTGRAAGTLQIVGHAIAVAITGSWPVIIRIEIVGDAIAIGIVIGGITVTVGILSRGEGAIAIIVGIEVIEHAIAIGIEGRTGGWVAIAVDVAILFTIKYPVAIAVGLGRGRNTEGEFGSLAAGAEA